MGFVLLTVWIARSETESALRESSLSASVEKSVARIGDLLWLTLTYDLPEGRHIPDEPVVGGIEMLTIVER